MAFSLGASNGLGGGRRRFGAGIGTLSEINVVPLVDVVLVLLIIFMLTAHVMEFGMEINVPQVKQVQDTAEEHPVVNITRDGNLSLNEKKININSLVSTLRSRFKDSNDVYVRADGVTKWDVVAQVLSELGQAKFGIKMVVKPEDSVKR